MDLQHLADVIIDAVPGCCGQSPSHDVSHDSTILANIYRNIPQILTQQFIKDNNFSTRLVRRCVQYANSLEKFSRDANFVSQRRAVLLVQKSHHQDDHTCMLCLGQN